MSDGSNRELKNYPTMKLLGCSTDGVTVNLCFIDEGSARYNIMLKHEDAKATLRALETALTPNSQG